MKSHEQDLLTMAGYILKDVTCQSNTDYASIKRDFDTLEKRLRHEGLSFLTITLPDFGKTFEKCLERGRVTSTDFQGWKHRQCLPAFLQGFTRLVFCAETGELFEDPDISAIEGIRQIAYSFKKLSLPCTPKRESVALSGFKDVERFLSDAMLPGDYHLFCEVSDLLWGNVFCDRYDPEVYIPKHGPGQTAERITNNRKYAHRSWTERLEPFFPLTSYLMTGASQFDDEIDGIGGIDLYQEERELPVRITCVPKTLKGPRIIAIEPVCMQYTQQALAGYMKTQLESHPLTKGHINFSDQSINRRLAVSASSDRKNATIDLSEASDRVPLSLVQIMLRTNPDLRDAILACRSGAAQMPDGELIPLKKFASMGSALCFPVGAMYYYTVILTALIKDRGTPVTWRELHKVSRQVYVYGDDIIVPTRLVDTIVETLADFYCKVNVSKSFWRGNFRESCGMDAYKGRDVTPTYVRHVRPSGRGDVSQLLSWIATSNLLYKRGYWWTASYMKDCVEGILGSLPIVQETCEGLGWISAQKGPNCRVRWNKTLHRFEVKTWKASTVYDDDPLDGYSALLKFMLTSVRRSVDDLMSTDKRHLERSPRSGTSCLQRRWVTTH